jgi:hypothetical protein
VTRAAALAIAAFLAVALPCTACRKAPALAEENTAPDGAVTSTLRTVVWGELILRVPADADSHGASDRFDLARRPHTRSPDTMSLRRSTAEEHATLLRTAKSRLVLSGGRLAYRVDRAEGGSGGPEATLVGEVELGGATYRVECHSQSEDREPPGDWCVPYLLTLEHR